MSCSICLDLLNKESDQIVVTSCRHIFHKKCLIKWFKSDIKNNNSFTSCPICREVIYNENDDDFDLKPSFYQLVTNNIYRFLRKKV